MRSRHAILHALVVVAVTALLAPSLALAQRWPARWYRSEPEGTPPMDFGAAISLNTESNVNDEPQCRQLGLPCLAGGQAPNFGLAFALARNFTERAGVVGEFSIHHELWDSWRTYKGTKREDNRVIALMAGPRFATPFHQHDSRRPDEVRYFGQLLVGAITSDAARGGGAVRPGVGVDIRTARGAVIRVQLDYTLVPGHMTGRSLEGARGMLGLVFGG